MDIVEIEWKEPLTPKSKNMKLAYGFVEEALEDEPYDLVAAVEALKCSISCSFNPDFPTQHFEVKNDILHQLKPIIKASKPPLCNSSKDEINMYEMFRTYYEIVKKLYTVESRQYYEKQGEHVPFRFKLGYVSGYNRWRKSIQYFTLLITLLSNVFKMALARMGGRASFIGTVLQGFAHFCFALYFLLLTNDDKALALPKIFGLVVSILTAFWIAEAGNGFL